jgi:hypothetical protein
MVTFKRTAMAAVGVELEASTRRLSRVPKSPAERSATQGKSGGGGRTRTYDVRIMSSATPVADKEDKGLSPADSGKVVQNPHLPRNKNPKDGGER